MSSCEFAKVNSDVQTFGMKLRNARIAVGITQKEAAVKAGISGMLWSQYESDYATPPVTYLKIISFLKDAAYKCIIHPNVEKRKMKYHVIRAKLESICAAVGTTLDELIPEGKQP